jgi:hypothetical protein
LWLHPREVKLTVTTAQPQVHWFVASVPTFVAHLKNRSPQTMRVYSTAVSVDSLSCNAKPMPRSGCGDVGYGVLPQVSDLPPGATVSFPIPLEPAMVSKHSWECIIPSFGNCEATFVYGRRGETDVRSNRVRFEARPIQMKSGSALPKWHPEYEGEPQAP